MLYLYCWLYPQVAIEYLLYLFDLNIKSIIGDVRPHHWRKWLKQVLILYKLIRSFVFCSYAQIFTLILQCILTVLSNPILILWLYSFWNYSPFSFKNNNRLVTKTVTSNFWILKGHIPYAFQKRQLLSYIISWSPFSFFKF